MAETENQEVLDEAQRAVQAACMKYLTEGETVVRWALTIEVEREDGVPFLAHRAGGGEDGTDEPAPWHVRALSESMSETMQRIMATGLPPGD